MYGSFAEAQQHAARFCLRGTAARTPFRDQHPRAKLSKLPITPDEALDSVEWVAEALGHWAGDGEYRALSNAQDSLRAIYGVKGFQFVQYDRVKRLWHNLAEATDAAKRRRVQRAHSVVQNMARPLPPQTLRKALTHRLHPDAAAPEERRSDAGRLIHGWIPGRSCRCAGLRQIPRCLIDRELLSERTIDRRAPAPTPRQSECV